MRFEQLRYLDAAIRAGTLRRAADELGIAQPSLSQQIQRLEEELDTVLLQRSSTGVRPTSACETLLPQLRAALHAEDVIFQEASALGGKTKGRVRVGAVGFPTRVILPGAVRTFRARYPGINLVAHEGHTQEIQTAVLHGELDLGIVARWTEERGDEENLNYTDLMTDVPLYVCVYRGHRLFDESSVRATDLAGEQFISSPSGHVLRAALERVAQTSDLSIVYYTDTSETVRIMVRAGIGIALLTQPPPAFDPAPEDDSIRFVQLAEPWASARMSILRRRHEQSSPAARALLTILEAESSRLSETQ